jgi:DNA-binding NtrC family response regulator
MLRVAAILIIDDEPVLAHQLAVALRSGGHEVTTAGNAYQGLEAAAESAPDLVLLDLRLPDRSGLDVIEDLRQLDSSILIVLMTAYGSMRDSIEAIRRGAADYLHKPLDASELGLLIDRLLRQQRRECELAYLRDHQAALLDGLIFESPRLLDVFSQVQRLCDAGLPAGKRPSILLSGETGSGKGVVARAIHDLLGGGPFIEANCSAMPASSIEAELFGRERGPEGPSRPGLFEAAESGTVFLDEVGDLNLELQGKFLRLIEEKRVRRMGSEREREVNVHVLASTHRDLDAAVTEGRFRADFLHRLRVLDFAIPPLRERPEDLHALADHFASEIARQYGGPPRQISDEAHKLLAGHAWPGNVRELRNLVERALLVSDSVELGLDVFEPLLSPTPAAGAHGCVALPEEGLRLEDVERDLLRQALARARGNQTRASALLGLSRDTFRYRIGKWGLDDEIESS